VGHVIDQAVATGDKDRLDSTLFYFSLITVVLAVATGLRFFFISSTGEYVIRDIRRDLYFKILELSPSFYEDNKTGDILSRLNTDTTLLQSVIGSTSSVLMRNIIMLLGSVIMLAISSIKLTMMIIIAIPIVLTPIMIMSKRLKKIAKLYQDSVANLASNSEESLLFIKVIQAYVQENKHKKEFEDDLNVVIKTGVIRILFRAMLVMIVIGLAFGGIGFVMWIGGRDVLEGRMSGGQLSTFIFLSLIAATTTMSITEAFGEVQKATGASKRIIEFLNIEPSIEDKEVTKKLPSARYRSLVFSNVSFSYVKDKPVLKGISFEAKAGKVLAIIGESGVGKSTIFQLILRFYDVNSGKVLIDNIDIRDISISELRDNFGYVSQDSAIFSTSAYDNIIYGNPNATYDEVVAASKAASAYDFIMQLPRGFDTFLGEKGAKLSGGQKQRIAIARAILKDPKILLLDEATSSLDQKNELIIQNALEKLTANRTTIIIAHRISTIIKADEIILIKNGLIVAQGTHSELMEESKEYQSYFTNMRH
jgi:ATP-binding cassette subfamily B protein